MIDPNELMIGNYVYPDNNHGDVVQVCAQDFESTEYLDPIPLTEQWLIDFGFERKDEGVSAQFHIGENPITLDWLFDVIWLKDHVDHSLKQYPFYRNGHFEMKHVHELQNLYFALTGKQLKK